MLLSSDFEVRGPVRSSMEFHLQKRAINSFAQREVVHEDGLADSGEYVFEIEQTADGSGYLSSMSDYTITLASSEELRTIAKVKAHTATINRIECSKNSPHLLVSAADDQWVYGWDTRSFNTGPVFGIKHSQEVSAVSLGLNGSLLASAYESTVSFHDVRFFDGSQHNSMNRPKALGAHNDAHSDTITQLKFHPTQSNILASASEDNLICTFDVSVADVEESVVSTFNTESPVARFGYFGEDYSAIYALSTNETLSFWHHSSAQRLAEFSSLREQLSMDYLVDCFSAPGSNDIYLLAGDHSGKGVVAQMLPTSYNVVGSLQNGHGATIRCSSASFSTSSNGTPVLKIVTGGEDARLCCWNSQQPSAVSTAAPVTQSHNSNGAAKGPAPHRQVGNMKAKKGNDLRFKPY